MEERRCKLDSLKVYQVARQFRRQVYHPLKQLPSQERHAWEPQMRRAAISVTNNIAEGDGRWHYQENGQHCRMARGSVEELLDDINICIDEGYGIETETNQLKEDAYALIAKSNGYIAYLRRCKQGAEAQ